MVNLNAAWESGCLMLKPVNPLEQNDNVDPLDSDEHLFCFLFSFQNFYTISLRVTQNQHSIPAPRRIESLHWQQLQVHGLERPAMGRWRSLWGKLARKVGEGGDHRDHEWRGRAMGQGQIWPNDPRSTSKWPMFEAIWSRTSYDCISYSLSVCINEFCLQEFIQINTIIFQQNE